MIATMRQIKSPYPTDNFVSEYLKPVLRNLHKNISGLDTKNTAEIIIFFYFQNIEVKFRKKEKGFDLEPIKNGKQ